MLITYCFEYAQTEKSKVIIKDICSIIKLLQYKKYSDGDI